MTENYVIDVLRASDALPHLTMTLVGRQWADPGDAALIAHDIVEHLPTDSGTHLQELRAHGAMVCTRNLSRQTYWGASLFVLALKPMFDAGYVFNNRFRHDDMLVRLRASVSATLPFSDAFNDWVEKHSYGISVELARGDLYARRRFVRKNKYYTVRNALTDIDASGQYHVELQPNRIQIVRM